MATKPPANPPRRRDRDTTDWTPVMVEREIVGLVDDMEDATADLIDMAKAKAEAEAAYKSAYAKAWLKAKASPGKGRSGQTTDGEAEQKARDAVEKEYLDHLVTEAKHGAQVEVLRSMRSSIEALRTVAANIRDQTRGH